MSRRRWIQINGELIEVTPDYVGESRATSTDSVLWNDRSYQDMGDARFASRTQHREYMKQHGLTIADDYKGEWRSKEEHRIKARNGFDPTRKSDIVEAIHKLRSR